MPVKIILPEELKQQILILREQGKGSRKIAKILNIPRGQIINLYKELGFYTYQQQRIIHPQEKECKLCHRVKKIDQFRQINKNNNYIYYDSKCLKCDRSQDRVRAKKAYYIKQKENLEYKKKFYQQNKEKLKQKNRECYLKNKDEILIQKKEYDQKNKIKKREYYLKYRAANKEKIRKKQKEYDRQNRDKINARSRKYTKERKAKDPNFKLRTRLSNMVNCMLKRHNASKQGESIKKYLPYTIQELKQHLESLFEPWMTWENWGVYKTEEWDDQDSSTWKWQIDHIIPHSEFKYISMTEESFQACWALANLRPYSAKQNIIDNDRK